MAPTWCYAFTHESIISAVECLNFNCVSSPLYNDEFTNSLSLEDVFTFQQGEGIRRRLLQILSISMCVDLKIGELRTLDYTELHRAPPVRN